MAVYDLMMNLSLHLCLSVCSSSCFVLDLLDYATNLMRLHGMVHGHRVETAVGEKVGPKPKVLGNFRVLDFGLDDISILKSHLFISVHPP